MTAYVHESLCQMTRLFATSPYQQLNDVLLKISLPCKSENNLQTEGFEQTKRTHLYAYFNNYMTVEAMSLSIGCAVNRDAKPNGDARLCWWANLSQSCVT